MSHHWPGAGPSGSGVYHDQQSRPQRCGPKDGFDEDGREIMLVGPWKGDPKEERALPMLHVLGVGREISDVLLKSRLILSCNMGPKKKKKRKKEKK
jgi:hypothetical protein